MLRAKCIPIVFEFQQCLFCILTNCQTYQICCAYKGYLNVNCNLSSFINLANHETSLRRKFAKAVKRGGLIQS